MGPHPIIRVLPALDEDLSLPERGKEFSVEQLIPKFAIEAFIVPVFPGTSRCDIQGCHPDLPQPLPHRLRTELGTVVTPRMAREASLGETIVPLADTEAEAVVEQMAWLMIVSGMRYPCEMGGLVFINPLCQTLLNLTMPAG